MIDCLESEFFWILEQILNNITPEYNLLAFIWLILEKTAVVFEVKRFVLFLWEEEELTWSAYEECSPIIIVKPVIWVQAFDSKIIHTVWLQVDHPKDQRVCGMKTWRRYHFTWQSIWITFWHPKGTKHATDIPVPIPSRTPIRKIGCVYLDIDKWQIEAFSI